MLRKIDGANLNARLLWHKRTDIQTTQGA